MYPLYPSFFYLSLVGINQGIQSPAVHFYSLKLEFRSCVMTSEKLGEITDSSYLLYVLCTKNITGIASRKHCYKAKVAIEIIVKHVQLLKTSLRVKFVDCCCLCFLKDLSHLSDCQI